MATRTAPRTRKLNVRKPRPTVPVLSIETLDYEREIYDADPTGGAASRY
jgi:hypothetical protein